MYFHPEPTQDHALEAHMFWVFFNRRHKYRRIGRFKSSGRQIECFESQQECFESQIECLSHLVDVFRLFHFLCVLHGQNYTVLEQKAILLIFISIIDKNINVRSKSNWPKTQLLIKMSINPSVYSCLWVYLELEKNW